jgi:hypothetical protein
MQKLTGYLNRIEQISLKKKIGIFLAFFVFSAVWVLVRNPIYRETTAFVFPLENTGDGRVYYSVKNGYYKPMSF